MTHEEAIDLIIETLDNTASGNPLLALNVIRTVVRDFRPAPPAPTPVEVTSDEPSDHAAPEGGEVEGEDLDSMFVSELQSIAEELGITGRRSMLKAELIEAIREARASA